MTISEIIKKEKEIQKRYKLNYMPKLFTEKQQVIDYLDKRQNKKIPIFYFSKSNFFITTHESDIEKMSKKGFVNLNTLQ